MSSIPHRCSCSAPRPPESDFRRPLLGPGQRGSVTALPVNRLDEFPECSRQILHDYDVNDYDVDVAEMTRNCLKSRYQLDSNVPSGQRDEAEQGARRRIGKFWIREGGFPRILIDL
jgi:hypothetical protein